MRLTLTLPLLLLLPVTSAQAGPINWFKHHPRASKFIAVGISSGVYAAGLHSCRSRGVEFCDGKYGASWGIFGASVGINLAIVPVSEKIGGIGGNALSYGWSAAQLGHGIYEWRNNGSQKVDLSGVAFVRH